MASISIFLQVPVLICMVVRCRPCHAIAPVFEKLAKQYTNVNFLKCDVDAVSEIAQAYQVSAM
jgi:thiol-disulfide isomerase/thioredoxin